MHGIASNKGFKKALIAAFLVAMMVVGPLGALQTGSAATASTTRDGGMYLKVAMQDDVKTLNPLSAGDVWTWNVIGWVFDGLVWRNNTNNDHIEPWAAEWFHHGPSTNWSSDPYPDNDNNPDYRNWTVKLRPDIKWHDWKSQEANNQTVKAHDVIFSLRLVADVPRYMSGVECIVARNPDGSIMYGRDLQNYSSGTKVPLENYENGKVTFLKDNDGNNITIDLSSQAKYTKLPVVYVTEDSDDLTLHYFTTYTYVDFTIDTLGALIFPERIWKDHIDDKTTWSDPQALINFGPFKFDYWHKSEMQSQISTFRDYFHTEYDEQGNPKPYIDGVQFFVYRSTDVAIQALQTGEVDYIAWTIGPSYIDTIQQDPHLTLVRNSDLGFFYVAFNMRMKDFGYKDYQSKDAGPNPKYADTGAIGDYTDVGKPFRIAVAHLIDKQTIVQTYLHGYGTVGTSVVSPANNFWYNPNIKVYGFDTDRANQILDSYAPDTDKNGVRELPTLGEQQITLMTPPADYDPIRQQAGQLIQTVAQNDAHLNIKAVPTQFGTIVDRINNHDFQLYMLGWSIPTPLSSATAPCDFFSSKYDMSGGNNYPGYHNESFDKLCDEMQREPNINKRKAIAYQLQEAIAEDVPYTVLYYRDVLEAYNNRFQGWVPRYGTIFNWYSLKNIKPQLKSSYELSMSIPTSVITGNSFKITALLKNKDTYEPISGVNVEFLVSLNGPKGPYTSIGNITTDEYGKAVIEYTPAVENTTISVKTSVHDSSTNEDITQIGNILILPEPLSEYKINMNILGVPTILQIDNGTSVLLYVQVTDFSTGEPIGEFNISTGTGINISISGASMDYMGYSDGKFAYVFTGTAPKNAVSAYVATITAEYMKDNSTLSTANSMIQFIVKGSAATGGTGGGTTTGNGTSGGTGGGTTTTGNNTTTGGGTGGGTTGNNTTTGGNNNGGGTGGGNNNGGGTGGGNNNGGGSTPSIGIIPVIISVGIAAIAYSEYRRKRKE